MRRILPLMVGFTAVVLLVAASPSPTPSPSNKASGAGATYNAYAHRPDAGTAGAVFICSDCPTALWADDGAAWHPLIEGSLAGTQPKVAANFASFNNNADAGPSTLTDRNGTLHYNYPSDGATTTVRGWVESLSSSTAHVEACVALNYPVLTSNNGFPSGGIVMRESGTGKMATLNLVMNVGVPAGEMSIEASGWTSSTSRGSVSVYGLFKTNAPICLRIRRSGSNTLFDVGTDIQNWINIKSLTTASVFTTAPDQVGVEGVVWVATDNAGFDVLHYVSGT